MVFIRVFWKTMMIALKKIKDVNLKVYIFLFTLKSVINNILSINNNDNGKNITKKEEMK